MNRRLPLLVFSIIIFGAEFFLIHSFSPTYQFSMAQQKISILILFFPVSFLSIFSLVTLLTTYKLQGVLVALFINGYLLLRLYGFPQLLYGILLFALFITIELACISFKKKKET